MHQILLVDDEQDFIDMITPVLEEAGHKVITALSVQEALKKYEEQEPDLVVTDMVMPSLSGTDLIKSIHQKKRQVPIITITGHRQNLKDESADALNVSLRLTKPIIDEDLVNSVNLILQA